MTVYLDTSVIVSALSREPASPRARAWMRRLEIGEALISPWVATEVAAALSAKVRTGSFRPTDQTAAWAGFESLARDQLRRVEVSAGHFALAARFAATPDLGLRAGDALHLAIAADQDAALATLDLQMAAAATALRIRVQDI